MYVIKRDNSEELFQLEKIERAVEKAFAQCGKEMNHNIIDCVVSNYDLPSDEKVHVEDIQDAVERCLMDYDKEVAKEYIIYRYNHKLIRENKDKLYKDITKKLMASDVQNQNANLDEHSFGGRMGEVNRLVLKDYALKYCMSRKSRNNHLNNEIYIHDLDSYAAGMHNCCKRTTKFITDSGVYSFEDFKDGDKVNVLTHTGVFKPATVHCYGNQQLNKITFTRSGREAIEYFTPNHRWILEDGTETTELKVGDRIIKARKHLYYDFESSNDSWVVTSIEEDTNEDVWCLDVESDHSFVLPNGIVTGNCLSVPFDDLLSKGFNTRQTDVRPANSINTAMQLVAVLFQLQSLQQFGGVSATHLDWTMVPYVKKSFFKHFKNGAKYIKGVEVNLEDFNDTMSIDDEKYVASGDVYTFAIEETERELYQAVEGMYHNLNTLQSRSGNQLPFTSINYGTCTLPEGRMVTKALIEGSLNGVGKYHKTPIFPCGIFQVKEGVNKRPDDPNYDLFRLALHSTALRLYPNYANCDWSGNKGYDENDPRTYFSTMGCRTANGFDINGFGQLKDGRGNICPVTIILPTLAMEAKEKVEEKANAEERKYTSDEVVSQFMKILTKKIEEAKDMLIERFEWICSQSPASARFMWENNTMAGYIPEEGIRSALKHGTLAMGQIGLAETLQILVHTDHTTEEGMKIAKEIEQLFNTKCKAYKEEYKLNFGVYYTPAENLCYTAMNKFRDKYGVIENVSDREYFTNSIHVPVWHDMNPFEKIDIESQLTGYSNAGCITYVELPSSAKNNIDALEKMVLYAMDKDIPYYAINVPSDTCECGYSDEIGECCPMCGSKNIQRLRRVTGYLTGSYLDAFNPGKIAEVRDRVKHVKSFD
jgi:ribonucleoside-triphosphate reductase